ncbi:hypothetical protein [Corynebacterium sp. 335C]
MTPTPAQQPPAPDAGRPGAPVDGYGPDGIDGSARGRTIGLASLVLGIGGLLTSPFMFGGVIGVVAIVLGIVAIVKSRAANKRVKAAGREPRTGGALGLGVVGIITGIAAVIIPIVIMQTVGQIMDECSHLPENSPEHGQCLVEKVTGSGGAGAPPSGGAE